MKRIYFLLAILMLAASSYAQRNPDLSVRHYLSKTTSGYTLIQDYQHLIFDGDQNTVYYAYWAIANHGLTALDTVASTDTIKVKSPWGTTYRTAMVANPPGWPVGGLRQHDTVYITPNPQNAIPTDPANWGFTSSMPDTINWCDSVYVKNPPGSPNPVNETAIANNRTCNPVILDAWMAGIKSVDFTGKGIVLFPNPTTGKLNFVYDFGNYSDATVTVVNIVGSTVYTKELKGMSGKEVVPVNVDNFAPGMYILKLSIGDKMSTERFNVR